MEQLTPEILALLQEMTPEELDLALFPYANEQGVIDQEMALGQQFRERAPQRSSPLGALFSGLANVAGGGAGAFMQGKGLKEQRKLGAMQQDDAQNRLNLLNAMMGQRGGALMTPAVDDSTLAALFGG